MYELRRENLREEVAKWGGPTALAKHLNYANGSFLSQMIGPNPTRDVTEKVARSIEQRLGLQDGYLDRPRGKKSGAATAAPQVTMTPPASSQGPQSSPPASSVDVDRLSASVAIVYQACIEGGLDLRDYKRFSELVALAYTSPGTGDEWAQHIRRLVSLLHT